jgi:hypothetical protein
MGWTEIPALGSNIFTITASRIYDKLGQIKVDYNDKCHDFASEVLAMDNPPYTTYRFHLSSFGSMNGSICDVGRDCSTTEGCISRIAIQYETFIVSTDTTVRQIDKKGILINMGAIVGAVAFIASFFLMYE